jgi:hypothetical protein
VVSLLKRWILGTLFFHLVQQAVAVQPVPYKSMVKCGGGA